MPNMGLLLTYHPEIKSHMFYSLSQSEAWKLLTLLPGVWLIKILT